MEPSDPNIVLQGAATHNLAGFDLQIPRRSLTVITGVSGSGKSSLAFDTLFREGQRRFLETLPSYARQFIGGLDRPEFQRLEGLGPAVALGQRITASNPRSTVGTLTEAWDLLRLLFARLGQGPEGLRPTRALFSFNGDEGACPACRGLGIEDRLDPGLLVADPARSLREGALRVSTPNGYLMYSQVTLAVLDEVLRAHGGSVDLPWQALSDEARQVVLFGSTRVKVPYGKHPLESRLKWTGITARPRQEGFYRGLVPVMEEILRGKRNDSILRFVRSAPCAACGGARLRPEALSVTWREHRIVDLAALPIRDLGARFADLRDDPRERAVLEPIRTDLLARCDLMDELGLGYLPLDRPASTLSRGEHQRLRLLGPALGGLRGLLVVLDEPSAGLHPHEVGRLLQVLRRMRDGGQTVVVVDHDAVLARAADWLIDLGPGPGKAGGHLLWSGPPSEWIAAPLSPEASPTQRWLAGALPPPVWTPRVPGGSLRLTGLCRHNVRDLSVDLQLGALNLVTGLSGAGKTSLLAAVTAQLQAGAVPDAPFRRIVAVDADPIGRTPRSNAATYTGAFDLLRDRFAGSDGARRLGLGKSHFSFNTAGGRCEACEGAGVREVGMRYLGSVDLLCETCGGRRFHPDVLAVKVQGRSIAEVLEGSIAEAAAAFSDHPRLKRILGALLDVGLGYLPLGQPATTLSGGEAQRVKLAAELAKAAEGPALIVLDEPTTGLHAADVRTLLEAWNRLLDAGHTLLVADHDLDVIQKAHHIVDLGPGSGPEGGTVVAAGPPEALRACESSLTGAALREPPQPPPAPTPAARIPPIELRGVRTHTLQGLDLTLPPRGLIAVTGPSGSGKSSLVFDTLLAEAQARFADLVSPWARRLLPRTGGAELEAARGLQATLAIPAQRQRRNPRATVGTATELDGRLRLLFSRAGTRPCPACGRPAEEDRCPCGQILPALWTSDFSPQSERGACPTCRGLGLLQRCDPERLVTRPDLPLEGGALAGTRYGATLGEADGQFMAILRHAAAQAGLDLSRPWRDLGSAERALAMAGTGETSYDVAWRYRRGRSEGIHRLTTPWDGLARLVEREYERIHADPRGEELEALMRDVPCPDCGGERLREPARRVTFAGTRLPELSAWPAEAVESWLRSLEGRLAPRIAGLTAGLRQDLLDGLSALSDAGLGYLSLNRELASLSGGEAQRVRLAASLGGGFSGVTYVLDEPSRGLHARDVDRLGSALKRLADAGNAVIVVEHDPALIARADHVMELGPGSGPEGGRLVAAGSPAELQRHPGSRTGAPLRSRRSAGSGREPHPGIPAVKLTNVQARNLQGFDVVLPAGALVCVTGVSGSGKSTFLLEVLAPSLRNHLRGQGAVGCAAFEALVDFQQVLTADQEGLGVAWNSTVLSLTGLGDTLRKRFAATPEAKARKLSARHFSTASPGGRCEACEGRGHLVIPMDLLPDVTVGCEACEGRRFRPEVLACRLHGRTLAEFLEATVGELGPILEGDPNLAPPLKALREVGLGYLRLGQEGSALSEGELQRLRLASLLADPFCGRTAILLDEPTRGLGFEDAARLADTLRSLAQSGHLVVTVTHDLGFIAASDWILDLGPEAGEAGGRLLVSGPPDAVRACPDSFTGQALRQR